MAIPQNTIINTKCLWVKDSNGNELNCGFVFLFNEQKFLIKYHTKRKEYIAIRKQRSKSGLINWRDEKWLKRVAKYTKIIGYVFDKTNIELMKEWEEYL